MCIQVKPHFCLPGHTGQHAPSGVTGYGQSGLAHSIFVHAIFPSAQVHCPHGSRRTTVPLGTIVPLPTSQPNTPVNTGGGAWLTPSAKVTHVFLSNQGMVRLHCYFFNILHLAFESLVCSRNLHFPAELQRLFRI